MGRWLDQQNKATQQSKARPLNFGQAIGIAGKRMGSAIGQGLLEIPRGIGRALATPVGFIQEAATGKRPKPLPFFGDYSAPRTTGEFVSRGLDTATIPGFGLGTAAKAIAPTATRKLTESAVRRFPRLSPEYKSVKKLIQERTLGQEVSSARFNREANQYLKPLAKSGEIKDFVALASGRASAVKPSEKLGRALEWYADVTKRQEESLVGRGLSRDILDERKYLELRRVTGKTTQEIKDTLGIKPDAAVKITDAIKNRKPFEPLYVPIELTDIPNWSQLYFGKFLQKAPKPSFTKKATGAGVESAHRDVDAFKLITKRHIKETKETFENQLVEDIKNKFGQKFTGVVPKGYKLWKPEGNIRFYPQETGIGVTKNVPEYIVPESVMDAYQVWAGGQVIRNRVFQESAKVLDAVTNIWKMTTLPLRPAWTAINTVGNVTLNVAGHVSPTSYIKALLPKYKNLVSKETLEKLGVKSLTGISEIRTGAFKGAAQKAYAPNQWIENWFRWVHFVDKAGKLAKVKAGKGASQETVLSIIKNSDEVQNLAKEQVNKYLFNYSGLSNAERDVVRRVVPFYTWIKNISRLSGEMAVQDTSQLARIYQVYKKVLSGTSDDENLPEYLRGSVETGLAINSDGKVVDAEKDKTSTPLYWNFKYMFPFYDVANIGLGSLNPAFKVPIERATGKQLFSQEAKEFTAPQYLGKYEKEPEKPSMIESIVKPTLEYKNRQLTSAKPSVLQHVLSQFAPYRLTETLTKPYAKYSATGKPIKSKYGKTLYPKSRELEILRYLTGVSLTPYGKK